MNRHTILRGSPPQTLRLRRTLLHASLIQPTFNIDAVFFRVGVEIGCVAEAGGDGGFVLRGAVFGTCGAFGAVAAGGGAWGDAAGLGKGALAFEVREGMRC